MRIKLGDFKINKRQRKIFKDIIASTRITEGKYVKLFEEEVSKFLGVKHTIAVTNGTVALQLVAQYIKYKYGGGLKICIPATTFPATLNAFLNIGFDTVLCDIDDSLCIDLDTLTEEEKHLIDVIVPVHLMGYTADMDKINKEAIKYGWIVVEDFAEAFGSKYGDRRVGSIGDFGCSSFYMSHVLQGGELGIVTTNDDEAAKVMRSMKNHGRDGNPMEFHHKYIGSNYKTTEFCAGLGYEQMTRADEIIKQRRNNATRIQTKVNNPYLECFAINENVSFLGYPIIAITGEYKKYICDKLNERGIETRGMFPCLANQEAYKDLNYKEKEYLCSEYMERTCFYVGIHQNLTIDEIDEIIKGLNDDF